MSISCVYLASPLEVACFKGAATNQFHKAAVRMGLKWYPWSNKHASYVSAINCAFVNEHGVMNCKCPAYIFQDAR